MNKLKISELYKKVESFSAAMRDSQLKKMQCKSGCSRCCYTNISVFEVEADFIRGWFSELSLLDKKKLIDSWQLPSSSCEDFKGNIQASCAFLVQEKCSIYEARPLICRTQGLPLKYKLNDELNTDICPLNREVLDDLKDSEAINLDTINLILAGIEGLSSKGELRAREKLKDLREELSS